MESAKKSIALLEKVNASNDIPYTLTNDNREFIPEFTRVLKASLSRHRAAVADSTLTAYISLIDAVIALEEVSIDQSDIHKSANHIG